MTKTKMSQAKTGTVRVLESWEYPEEITRASGAFTPDVKLAIIHPLGLYWADHQGAGHLAVYFLPKRKGSRRKAVGGASSIAGALRRISNHEDQLVNPDAKRHDGRGRPVNMLMLGERVDTKKTPTQLDDEIARFLALPGVPLVEGE